MTPELTVTQVILVGLVASVITWLIGVILAWKPGLTMNKTVLSIVLYVISVVLAVLFLTPALPVWTGDIATYVPALLLLAGTVTGTAYLIYNILLEKVLAKLNVKPARFLKPK